MKRLVIFWSSLLLSIFALAPRISPAQVGRGGEPALEAAIAHAQAEVGQAYGPCTFRDGDGYLGLEGEVAVYALEFYSPQQRSPVTAIVDGRALGLPVIETYLGLPPHRDPDAVARALQAVAAWTGKPAVTPDVFLCPAWPAVWAAFPQPGAASSSRLYCNLADNRIATLASLGAKAIGESGSGTAKPLVDSVSKPLVVSLDKPLEVITPTVLYPSDASINLLLGGTSTIRWSGFSGTSVKIELYSGTTRVLTIASATPNDGSQSWTVPSTLARGASYKIKITATANAAQYDWSNNTFCISLAKVVAPSASGIVWQPGQTYSIQWNGYMGPSVRIELYNGSVLSRTIAPAAYNNNVYPWKVPSDLPPGTNYKIKIAANAYPWIFDWSDASFAVMGQAVLYPSDASINLLLGGTSTIRWSGFSGTSVKIELYSGTTRVLTIASATPNDGTQTWTVPSTLARGASYKIKISAAANAAQYDWSNNTFCISLPKVVAPSASGTVWQPGQSYSIQWSGYMGPSVRIELYNGSALSRTIAAAAYNNSVYSWKVPSDLPLGANYKVKIVANAYPWIYDWSDASFAVMAQRVTSPSSTGITWIPGKSYTITWSGFSGSTVKIELYKGTALSRVLAASTANDGSFAWTVLNSQATGTDYKIKISSTASATISDWSDSPFTIDSSFFPVLMTDSSGMPVNAWWKYRFNSGKSISFDEEIDGESAELSVKVNDVTIKIDRTRLERSGSFTGKISGDATGDYSASFVEKLRNSATQVLVTEQSIDMDVSISADDLDIDISMDYDISDIDPPVEWFLDRADLDKLSVGYVFDQSDDVTGYIDLHVNMDVDGDSYEDFEWDGPVNTTERWQIMEKLSKMTVQGKEYRNIVKVKRTTVMPSVEGEPEDVDMIYWVAKGIGMIKGEGQFEIYGKPVPIELVDTNIRP